jgi:two-component system, sensor histidine kinase PdtaS
MNQNAESSPEYPSSLPPLLEAALHADPDCIVLLDTQGEMMFCNAAALAMSINRRDEKASRLERIIQENRAAVLQSGQAEYGEFKDETEGNVCEYEYALLPLRAPGGPVNALLFRVRDVTVEHQALENLEECNRHLRESMQETHHRVKNNLQVISSLVEMQSDGMNDAITVPMQRIKQHVQALAVIHDFLTQEAKEDVVAQRISSQQMLEKLLPLLQTILPERSINYDIADVILPAREASALALICNELISNASKHGAGEVNLIFRHENGAGVLEVSDNGRGFPPTFNPEKSANTGLELVRNLARWDLSGDIRFFNCEAGGACITIKFPIAPV